MRFPFFASFIVFGIWLSYEIHKHRNIEAGALDSFWEKENTANNTRKQSLENLDYIQLPLDSLSLQLLSGTPEAEECIAIFHELSCKKIVNLTGISNTDLKLQYGAANLNLLTSYDQNYTLLARTLNKWGHLLYEAGYLQQARSVLEFAVATHTDISSTYRLLAQLYTAQNEPHKIKELLTVAGGLNSAMKGPIVRILQEFCPHTGSPDFG